MQKKFFYLKGRPFVFLSTTGHGTKGASEEAGLAFSRLTKELEKLGGSIDDVVRTTVLGTLTGSVAEGRSSSWLSR